MFKSWNAIRFCIPFFFWHFYDTQSVSRTMSSWFYVLNISVNLDEIVFKWRKNRWKWVEQSCPVHRSPFTVQYSKPFGICSLFVLIVFAIKNVQKSNFIWGRIKSSMAHCFREMSAIERFARYEFSTWCNKFWFIVCTHIEFISKIAFYALFFFIF